MYRNRKTRNIIENEVEEIEEEEEEENNGIRNSLEEGKRKESNQNKKLKRSQKKKINLEEEENNNEKEIVDESTEKTKKLQKKQKNTKTKKINTRKRKSNELETNIENNEDEFIQPTKELELEEAVEVVEIPSVKSNKKKSKHGDRKLSLSENGEIDINIVTIKDIIELSNEYGKPTRAAQEKENRRQEQLEQAFNSISSPLRLTSSISNSAPIAITSVALHGEEEETVISLDQVVHSDNPYAVSSSSNSRRISAQQAPLLGPAVRSSVPAPRMVFRDGELTVDEESLVIHDEPVQRDLVPVIENGTYVNSNSFRNRSRAINWTSEDTVLFYYGVRQFGTDFALIEQLFPGRDRTQIKNKYKKEYKENYLQIQNALKNPIPIDMENWKKARKVKSSNKDQENQLEEVEEELEDNSQLQPPITTQSIESQIPSIPPKPMQQIEKQIEKQQQEEISLERRRKTITEQSTIKEKELEEEEGDEEEGITFGEGNKMEDESEKSNKEEENPYAGI